MIRDVVELMNDIARTFPTIIQSDDTVSDIQQHTLCCEDDAIEVYELLTDEGY